jgi:SWI/SNF-related matrix-associated actin-dependent regulator 1 of chromatin subfamily A
MDSDPIVSSPVKRQKTAGGFRPAGRRPQTQSQTSASGTIPTQILSRPAPQANLTFANLMADLTGDSQPFSTQPTQLLPTAQKRSHSSTPTVQVARSSPAPVPESPLPQPHSRPQSTLGARFAPPGTAFRRPGGIPQPRHVPLINIDDDDDFVDPPVDRSSDTEGPATQSTIIPTAFTKGGRNLDSSPNRVYESPKSSAEKFKSLTSSFAYSAGGMESAYGGVSRNKPQQRQPAPSRAQPVEDMTINDIFEVPDQKKVERMMTVAPGRPISVLYKALKTCHGSFDDAVDMIFRQEGDKGDMDIVDLTSSDIESNVAKPSAQPRAAAKQQVKAPTRTIADKYSTKPKPTGATTPEAAKPRRRLMQGRKNPVSPIGSPSPTKPVEAVPKKRAVIIDSDDSDAESGKESSEEDTSDFDGRLLKFFNTCSAQDLADMSNEKLEIAQFILSKKPFRSLNAIRNISDAPPLKSGKKSAKKAIGDKVLDVCAEMYRGYEAVDELVEKCDNLGKPIADTMKQWGIDFAAATKDGELALTSLEDTQHDSGMGTPASSTGILDDDDDDIVKPKTSRPNKLKKNIFLKQPTNMSTDLTMKDYQLFGLNWLNLLWSKKLSCILADDMGLGKTCQVIAFLAHLKQMEVPGVHLVVVPGSTLENWIRELNRFCPALNVAPYYGSQAERENQRYDYGSRLDEIDVIVTTYETAVGKYDTDFLRKTVRPVVCVFDEGHALKNSQSKRHQQLMRIPAEFRLLLTGTPLQNNLQELASLLSFILPSLFNSRREDLDSIFKFKATTKDADHAALLSAQRIARARSMMTPFILRRKKQQVLKHMPAKHRRVEYCDMLPEQRDVYNEMVKQAVDARAQPKKGGAKAAKTAQEMTALRFAALHPLLLRRKYGDKELTKMAKTLQRSEEYGDNKPELIWRLLTEQTKGGDFGMHRFCLEYDFLTKYALINNEWMNSGKVNKLKELLEGYIKNGDRTLIFSQFTTMMDILESVLETLSIKFMRLDGSTAMATRQDIIDQFTTDTSIPVFMLSTKAGGAGINLACANKVIILDSGFNPQDDIQAENRAHRVGQTRDVEVVRLVTRGTIEEQIHALGESKLALDDRVAGAAEDAAAEKKLEADAALAVEDMFFKHLTEEKKDEHPKMEDKDSIDAMDITRDDTASAKSKDLRDEFRNGLKDAGLDVKEEEDVKAEADVKEEVDVKKE